MILHGNKVCVYLDNDEVHAGTLYNNYKGEGPVEIVSRNKTTIFPEHRIVKVVEQ